MRLVSIRKYLDQARAPALTDAAGPAPICLPECLDFLTEALPLLPPGGAQPGAAPPAPGQLASDASARAAAFRAAARQVQLWHESGKRRENEQRLEIQRLMAAFNQAVVALASGGETASERLARVESALARAARMDSLPAMRGALHEATETLRREAEAHKAQTAGKVAEFGRRLDDFRGSTGHRAATAGRDQAVSMIRAWRPAPGLQRAVVAAVFDRLPAVCSRFGPALAEEALSAFAAEQARPAAGSGLYRWDDLTLVWPVETSSDLSSLRQSLEKLLDEPFEYRTIAAGRNAVLSLQPRWMWATLEQASPGQLIEEIDLFARGAPHRW